MLQYRYEGDMETISYRVIRNEPGEFEELLAREGTLILNKNGEPFAIILDAASESLETMLRLVSQVRAQMAVAEMRSIARERGLDRLTRKEIEAEIQAVRARR
jgi:hypothetical protein